MLQWTRPFSRRAILASAFAAVTITAAGAATYHRLAVTQSAGGGSEGATEFLQSGTGGAVQGEVASSAYTGFPYQFGLFGFYHGAANQLGIGALGISSNGYGVAGAGEGGLPAVLAQAEGNGYGLEAITTSTSNTAPAIFAAPKGGAAADGIDALISGGTRNYAVSGTDTAGTGSGHAGI